MKSEVFLPLGMTHTSIDVEPGLEAYAAVRYDKRGNPVAFYVSADHAGASAVYSSAHDLIRFALFHLKHTQPDQKPILAPSTIDRMKQDSDPNRKRKNDRHGLAWALEKDEYGYDVVLHGGGMDGVSTMLKFVPAQDIAVVVLINTTSDLVIKITNDVIGTLLPAYGAKWKVERDKPRVRTAPFKKPVPELIGEWKGELRTYEETTPVIMTIQGDGDVHVKIGSQYGDAAQRGGVRGPLPVRQELRHDSFRRRPCASVHHRLSTAPR